MNFVKPISKIAACLLMSSILFTGCASEKEVTSENAPNDLMKNLAEISSESSREDVTSALAAVITKTAEHYDYKIGAKDSGEGTTLDLKDGTIKTVPITSTNYDFRISDGNAVYEFLNTNIQDRKQSGFMKADSKEITTIYADAVKGTPDDSSMEFSFVDSESEEQTQKYTEAEIQETVKNTVMIPLFSYLGANLIVSPTAMPEFYDYSLVQKGNQYVFKLSIKDVDEYNEYLDEYNKTTFNTERTDLNRDGSVIADDYVTDRVNIEVTMDSEGVIQSISNSNYSKVSSEIDQTDDVYFNESITIFAAPEALKTSIVNFFDQFDDGEIKTGDSFTILFKGDSTTESDKKDQDDSESDDQKDSSSKETDNTGESESADKK